MEDDFGYFGSGLEGYVHYMDATDQAMSDFVPSDVANYNSVDIELENNDLFDDGSADEFLDDIDVEDEDDYLDSLDDDF